MSAGEITGAEITEDQVLGGRLTLLQPRDGYRVAIDPILLAAAVPAIAGESVLDLGCGIGTAGLCVAKRVAGVAVAGIDLQPWLVELAQRNAQANGLAGRAAFAVGDVLVPVTEPYQHVLANPPYLERAKASISPNPIKAAANVEGAARLADWVQAATQAVAPGGSVTFIHRAERTLELQRLMATGLGAVTLLPLLPKAGAAAKRVLVQGVKGAPHTLEVLSPLILHAADGAFTGAADAVLRDMAALSLRPDLV